MFKKSQVFQTQHIKKGIDLRGRGAGQDLGGISFSRLCPVQRLKARRVVAEMLGKKKAASLDVFSKVEKVELEHELAHSAFFCHFELCREGTWVEDGRDAWRRKSWNKVRGFVGAVCCESRDEDTRWPAWDTPHGGRYSFWIAVPQRQVMLRKIC